MIEIANSPQETRRCGARFAKRLKPPRRVGLFGDLGSGKTTFVQGMAEGLGIDPRTYVNSPTFTLVNEYRGPRCPLVHMDLYRIADPSEIETLALEEYGRSGEIVVIEWADRLGEKKMLDCEVFFEIRSARVRRIKIDGL